MPAVIGAIIFASLFLLLITQQSNLLSSMDRHSAETTYIHNSASEMAQFYAASLKFLSGFGSPSNGKYITVSDLKASGLLPGAFPDLTPFGFQLQGWPVEDPSNNSITNLTIISAAPLNNNSNISSVINGLNATGFGLFNSGNIPVGDIQEIDEKVESLLTPSLLSQYSGPLNSSQAQSVTIGHTNNNNGNLSIETGTGTVLVSNTGVPSSQLPNYQSSSPAIEVIAPNQLGYTLISYSGYFDGTPWQNVSGYSESNGDVNYSTFYSPPNAEPVQIGLSNLGWSPTCPSAGTLITPSTQPFTDQENTVNGNNDVPATGLICLKSYRSEKVNLQYYYSTSDDNATSDFINNSNFEVNNGNTWSNPLEMYTYVNGASNWGISDGNPFGFSYSAGQGAITSHLKDLPYVNPNMIDQPLSTSNALINKKTYSTPWPQNNFWAGTIPTLFANIGLNITLLQPSGKTSATVNTYQILFGSYQIPTGSGYTWHKLGLPNPDSTQTGSTGLASWNNNYTVWRGFCMGSVQNSGHDCQPDADNQYQRLNNLFSSSNRSQITGLGTSAVTSGWYFQVTPTSNTGSNTLEQSEGGTVNALPYDYAVNNGQNYTLYQQTFNATIPSTAMCDDNYQSGQSGNCPGYQNN